MGQEFHRFRGASLDEAYQRMRQQLGSDAVVLRTTQVREAGLFGFLGKKVIEVTASKQAQRAAQAAAPAMRAYTDVTRQTRIGSDEAVQDSVAYFQKLVSDAQKRLAERRGQDPATPATPATPAPVVPFRRPKDEAVAGDALHREIRELRELVEVLVAEAPGSAMPLECAPHYKRLIENGVSRKAAAGLLAAVVRESDLDVIRDPRVFEQRLVMEMRKSVRVTGGIGLSAGTCKRIALVGATGVGKTTNLAKLAAKYAVTHRARVALITADTYRVAAPEQLRVYANIIGIPLRVVHDAAEMTKAIEATRDFDLVLIDTAGGSQFNKGQLRELREMMTAAQPDETILVLSAGTALEDARCIVENFALLKPSALFFTKLDETRRHGNIFTLSTESGLPLSYLSTGQNVPDDLALAQPEYVAQLVLGAASNLAGK
ncbi:MAG TPA: flagellar biosynthesis protein FlhF [Candidatus Hydrogenedentes bacterium]|nr:flagellar biosynthesis protein FlhF [Candidatus Hydrogenedentota bacterium]